MRGTTLLDLGAECVSVGQVQCPELDGEIDAGRFPPARLGEPVA